MPSYSGSYDSGTFDLWQGLELYQPVTPSAYRTGVCDATYFGKQVMDNLLASIRASVAAPGYRQAWTCASGVATGNPVRISASGTVALAEASGSGTSDVIGFVRDKSGDTTAYVAHFWRASGITGTVGQVAYLQDDGTVSNAAGTFRRALGIYDTTTSAILFASPQDAANLIDGRLASDQYTVSISGNAESGNYRAVTVQCKNIWGVSITSRQLVEAWLSDSDYGWETATAPTGFIIVSGTTGDTPTAAKRLRGITGSDGSITFHVQTDAVITYSFNVSVAGAVYCATLEFS